tara:strand:+ start:11079 stop:12089 length:1011 start_codon:yes stop_codon:yes gene_type:complete
MSFQGGYGDHFNQLQTIYYQELGRPIDLDGYIRYSKAISTRELSLFTIRNIIHNSDEATLYHKRKETQLALKTQHNVKISESIRALHINKIPNPTLPLHIVITRYNESYRWIKSLSKLQDVCNIYVYNKGDAMSWPDKPCNVSIIDIPNIGFEEYGYVFHLIHMHQYYNEHKTKIIFLQCGLDHCPHFLRRLRHVNSWSSYTSLYESIGMSNTWSDEQNTNTKALIPVERNMLDIGGGKEYVSHFLKVLDLTDEQGKDLYDHFTYLFGLYKMKNPIFSPCAVFCVTYNGQIPLRTLHSINNTIEGVYTKGDYFVSKVLASIIERLWYTIFIQDQLR